MSNAEKFIEENTRNCSNENVYGVCEAWLTPESAYEAVRIARQQVIDKAIEWLKQNITYTHPRKGTEECIINLSKFKEAMMED